jgi:alpha-glucosidase
MRSRIAILLFVVSAYVSPLFAQTQTKISNVRSSSNGLALHAKGIHVLVQALREDVLRVRYWRGAAMPEDASWAVLPEARKSSVPVAPLKGKNGFTTSVLRVEVNPVSLQITVFDAKGNILQEDAAPIDFHGDAFELSQKMTFDSHYFGLGDKTGGLDRREQAFALWNTDAYLWQESTDPLYKAIPFFITYDSGRAIGTLLDNTWRSHFDFGRTRRNNLLMGSVNGPVDYYLLYGPSSKQVLATYAWLTGPTPLPPLWAFGYQQSRYSYMTQARVEEVAKRLRSDRIPTDAIYLDIDYQDRNRPFTGDQKAFPDFAGMIRTLHEEQMRVVAITDLHIANAPGQNYAPYDEGKAQDRFVHNPDGSVYTGEVWPGPAVFPDFTQRSSREWWGSLYTDFVHQGLDGFWNDMNEPSVFKTPSKTMPEEAVHRIEEPGFRRRTATHSEIHNIFGMQNSRATWEGLLQLRPNERPFVLTRAAYAGSQRYAATWTGDNSSTWNHLRMSTIMLKNLGLSGYSLTGADVGGFIGNPSPELLTKWMEIAAFQPIDRDHTEKGSADQEPWVHGLEHEAIRRRFIEERYGLLPYIYTTAEENVRTGLPIVRPLFMEFPEATADKHPMDLDRAAANEFMLGEGLLIAPPPQLEQTEPYDVQFPTSGWYDYWTGKRLQTAETKVSAATVTPRLDELPVYVRPGTILPYAPLTQSTQEIPQGPLTLRVYPGPNCHGALYSDDGHSFAYKNGEFLRMKFTCATASNGGLSVHVGAHEGTFRPWWSQLQVEVFGLSLSAPSVEWRNQRVDSTMRGAALTVLLPDDGKGFDVTFAESAK